MAQKDDSERIPLSEHLGGMSLSDSVPNAEDKSKTVRQFIPGASFKRVVATFESPPGYIAEESSWSSCCADEVSSIG